MLSFEILRERKKDLPFIWKAASKKLGKICAKRGRFKTKHHPTRLWGQNQTLTVSYCFHFVAHRSKASHSQGVSKKDPVTVESKIIQRGICKWSEFFSLAQTGELALLIREKLLLPVFYPEGPRTLCINGKMK